VLIYENEEGKTCVEYDRPSSLFGQFGNANKTEVAVTLDRKLERLVADATKLSRAPREQPWRVFASHTEAGNTRTKPSSWR
jgi:hypothetical protein